MVKFLLDRCGRELFGMTGLVVVEENLEQWSSEEEMWSEEESWGG